MKFNRLLTPFVLGFITAFLAIGCDVGNVGTSGPSEVAVKMNLTTSSQAKMKTSTSTTPSFQAVDTLTQVKLLVEELELESALDADSLDFEAENLIVDLPLDGSDFVLSSATVPEGVYDEFELEIEHDDEDINISDPDFQDNGNYYAIVIKGLYNGEEFTYKSEEEFEIELELNPPIEITETSSSFAVNINIDSSGWFIDPDTGETLDPTNPDNFEQIEENIEHSFDAESEEEDHDDDHEEEEEDEDEDEDNDDDSDSSDD